MKIADNTITQGQFMFFILQTQIGVGVLSLPHQVQSSAKGAGWISVIIAGLASQLIILFLWALNKRFPSSTIYEFLTQLFGKFTGTILGLAYVSYAIFTSADILVLFSDIVSRWILPATPRWVVILIVIVTCMYMAVENLRNIARFLVATSILIPVFLALAIYSMMVNMNVDYIFPLTEAGWLDIIKGSQKALFSMVGFELILLAYPLVEGNSGGKLKAISLANLLVTLLYSFLTFTCLVIFSPREIEVIPEPLLYMLKSFTFNVIERIDLIFLSIWSVSVFTTFISYIFMGMMGLGQYFHKGNHKKAAWWAGIICFVLAVWAGQPEKIRLYDKIFSIGSFIMIMVVPLLLLGWSYLFKVKGETST
ncbi:spore germination protein (amino acid permease) [Laceyella sediminis]|uniref:Spore germination protein (Amino acid permease) n=1 Tax=Laceyella sediminis TaxID=573074 RepID=A0ABX5EMY7_9BACL|nr:GerAB/ArcD/ProY family transporter [Laceyella sediminis]PRZ12466.1 spore germination protein (amino acid permease) [Laceyella sediminis]